jgi:hypothetical protein
MSVGLFSLTDVQHIFLGKDGKNVVYGQYLASTANAIRDGDDETIRSVWST